MSRLDKINKALADLKKEEIAIKKVKDFVAKQLMIVQAEESNMKSYVHKHSAALLKKQLAENETKEDSRSQMVPVQNNQVQGPMVPNPGPNNQITIKDDDLKPLNLDGLDE
ncbi:hypothetical protein CDAR_3261 [Caerostris darwini]|uniref:Uncharacterized protein n=1 Tax=Caerostris darwini TaxID=1538125 RepID=A0AAV4SZC4_9ARAC|nr:hypothetical protein CDAR_3261 [Caerostris darwini]